MTGNTILITGGTSGIGLGLALRLHEAGNKVIVGPTSNPDADYAVRINPALYM
jgi:short-subunit dehydrogenase involved in D-alanine esterification of teichoic acids